MALTDNLLAYYKFDESSGNAADSVGSNTLTNTNVTYAAGKLGNCAVFDSTTDKLQLASNITPTSFSFWSYFTNVDNLTIFHSASPDNAINGQSTTNKILLYDGSSHVGSNAWTLNAWTHYVFVFTTAGGNGYDIYKNGVFLERISCNQLQWISISRTNVAFQGKMDEVGVWSRALSADEVSQLYNSNRALAYPLTAPTLYGGVAYYKLDESSGNAADSIGTNTLTNRSTTQYVAGKINNGADFGTSTSNYALERTDGLGVELASAFSYSLWIKLNSDTLSNTERQLLNWRSTAGTDRYSILKYGDTSGTKSIRLDQSGTSITYASGALGTTNWYHFAVTCSAAGATTIYMNGNSVATGSRGTGTSTNVFSIGQSNDQTNLGNATITDEVVCFNRELTSTEISTLYNAGAGLQYPWNYKNAKTLSGNNRWNIKSISGNLIANTKSVDSNA